MSNAVRAPVRPATRWMRVVSMASASVISGRIVVRRQLETRPRSYRIQVASQEASVVPTSRPSAGVWPILSTNSEAATVA
jgi:hypothetical protein